MVKVERRKFFRKYGVQQKIFFSFKRRVDDAHHFHFKGGVCEPVLGSRMICRQLNEEGLIYLWGLADQPF